MSDSAMDALSRGVFDWFVEWNPLVATGVGIHDRDHLMPKGTYQAELEERRQVKGFLAKLEDIDKKALSPSKRVDYGVLRNAMRLWVFQSEEIGIWQSMPEATDNLGGALFPLFIRSFAPLPTRLGSITERLERTPAYFAEMKGRVRTPVKIWSEIALESTQRMPGFLGLIQAAGKDVLPNADRARLDEAVAKGNEVLADYGRWIESDVIPRAATRVGIGATKFRKLVRLRELGKTVDEIYALGRKFLLDSKRELNRLANEIRTGARVDEAKEIVKSDHPKTFTEALEYTRTVMSEAKKFVLDHGLATIPATDELTVIETPVFIRHVIPFAAYYSPAKFEKRQQGFYFVTPVEDKPEMLREHSFAGTRNTAVHEAYPGHHVQLTCANLNPSHARILAGATETIEGWAHYCEDMMKEAGFSADPKTKFVQITDQIWRACRIIIDIDLHTGNMNFDEAVEFLVRESGMERPGAIAEVKRYTYNPAYQLSYLLGKHMILGLKKDVKKGLGKQFSDRLFHDTILYAGSLPMKYIREIFEHKVKELRKLHRAGL